MTFALIQAFLQSVLNLGGVLGSKLDERGQVILSALRAGKSIIGQVNVGAEDLRKLTEEINAMGTEGVPSDEQLDALQARFQAAYDVAEEYLRTHGEESED